ncbi:MAG: hypothetical protein KBF12_11515 [Sebaldella sp.]|nr:hypothetical protein [Sebaldella sp.]
MYNVMEYKSIKSRMKISMILTLLMCIPTNYGMVKALLNVSEPHYIENLIISMPIVLLGDFCVFLQIKSLFDLKKESNLLKIKKRYKFLRIFYIFYFFIGLLPTVLMFSIPSLIDKLLIKLDGK